MTPRSLLHPARVARKPVLSSQSDERLVDLVRAGTAPKMVQDESQATYEGWCKKEHVQIDWQKPLETIWNLIRGADPQPGAWTTHEGTTVQLLDAKKLAGSATGGSGQVIAVEYAVLPKFGGT